MSASFKRVALLGYGRFGRSFADLLEDAGIEVRALDPTVEVPSARRADSTESLVRGADAIVLATPVHALADGLAAILPHVRPTQLVIDVASVKLQPVAMLTEALGRTIPWAATHPLFGPSSVAAGERPLRVVVCPNPLHPAAAAAARRLYERLGCVVAEHGAAEHDRLMARTHALAFFVAKGLLDIGLRADLPFAPPSFRAMARTLEAVQSDAGHLFLTIERDNPHAAGSRRELLDALGRIDAALDAVGDAQRSEQTDAIPGEAGPTTIPELRTTAADRCEVGELIAACDVDLTRALARRARLVGRLHRERSDASGAPDVERLRRRWAGEPGLLGDELEAAIRVLKGLEDTE